MVNVLTSLPFLWAFFVVFSWFFFTPNSWVISARSRVGCFVYCDVWRLRRDGCQLVAGLCFASFCNSIWLYVIPRTIPVDHWIRSSVVGLFCLCGSAQFCILYSAGKVHNKTSRRTLARFRNVNLFHYNFKNLKCLIYHVFIKPLKLIFNDERT